MPINIAIDGTAGSGKGTLAKQLAKKLGFGYLDTGAIYRSVAYYMVETGVDLSKGENIAKAVKKINFKVVFEADENGNKVQKNILDGTDLGEKIRTEEISLASSIVSQVKEVREFATKIQHEIASSFDVVVEGRDIGTVVCPDAQMKVFLTASAEVRAQRRLKELQEKGICAIYDEILKKVKERDARDTNRETAPLKPAADALFLDTSSMTADDVFAIVLREMKGKGLI